MKSRTAVFFSLFVASTSALLTSACTEGKKERVEGIVSDWALEEVFDENMEVLPEEQRKTLVTFDGNTAYILDFNKNLPVIPMGCKLTLDVDRSNYPILSFKFDMKGGMDFRKKFSAKLIDVKECPSLLEQSEVTVTDEKGNVINQLKESDTTNRVKTNESPT